MTKYLYYLAFLTILVCGCSPKKQRNFERSAYDWSKNNFRKDLDSTLTLIDYVKNETKDLYWFAKFEYLLAAIELRNGENLVAQQRSIQALEILKNIESDDVTLYYGLTRNIAAMQANSENHEAAIISYDEAIKFAHEVGRDQKTIDYARFNRAVSKTKTNRFEEGQAELLQLYKESDKSVQLRASLELGRNARDIEMHERSIEYFKKAISLDDGYLYGDAELEIAKTLAAMGDDEQALKYLDASLKKMTDNYGRFVVSLEKGKLQLSNGDQAGSVESFQNALSNWEFGTNMKFIEIYDYLHEAYMSINISTAMDYKRKYRNLRELKSRNLTESNRQASIRQTEFQAESIRLITLQKEERKRLITQRAVLSIIVLSLLAGIGWYHRRYRKGQKDRENMVEFALAKIEEIDRS